MTMNKDDARRIVGRHSPQGLRTIAKALAMHPWNNTRAEWDRLEAACTLLGAFAPDAAKRALALAAKAGRGKANN